MNNSDLSKNTSKNIFEEKMDSPPSLRNPFICNLIEFVEFDEKNQHTTCVLEDDNNTKVLGFFYKTFANILKERAVQSRIPFKISIIKGKINDLGGIMTFEVYHAVFEKNTLINSSAMSSYAFCPAQIYFRNHINVEGDLNANLLYGVLLHDYLSIIFDNPNLLDYQPGDKRLSDLVDNAFLKAIHNNWRLLTAIGVSEEEIFTAFLNSSYDREYEFLNYEIERLQESNDQYEFQNEKFIRSKNFGLQGRIDRLLWNKTKDLFTLIETKTGKSSASSADAAKNQLISYAIILQEYFADEVEELILEYPRNEVKHRLFILDYEEEVFNRVLGMRNEVWAISVGVRPEFGPFMHCSTCWSKDICSFYCLRSYLSTHCKSCDKCKYSPLIEDKDSFEEFKRANVYYDWFFQFLEAEYLANLSMIAEVNLDPHERQNIGNCLADVVVSDIKSRDQIDENLDDTSSTGQQPEISDRICVTLMKKEFTKSDELPNNKNLSGTRFNKGDYVLLTPQNYIPLTVESFPSSIKKINDHEIILELRKIFEKTLSSYPSNTLFRIDSTASNDILNKQRSALDKILRKPYSKGNEDLLNLRKYLLNLPLLKKSESDKKNSANQQIIDKKYDIDFIKQELIEKQFNKEQIKAILRSLDFEGIQLIHGPPGTGKTTVIAEILFQLFKMSNQHNIKNSAPINFEEKQKSTGTKEKQGSSEKKEEKSVINDFKFEIEYIRKPILVSAYTNRAVDNILEKIIQKHPEIKIIRLGSKNSISPKIKKYSLQNISEINKKLDNNEIITVISPKLARKAIEGANIIAATCIGSNNMVLKNIYFDYVIIDEAGQVIEPAALIPLTKARKVILIGDDQQLPPISQNQKNPDFDEGFFENKPYLRDFNPSINIHPSESDHLTKRKEIFESTLKSIKLSQDDTLSTSIFQRLKRNYKKTNSFIALKKQFRMNKIISDFISETFYENQLTPGKIGQVNIGKRTLKDFYEKMDIPFFNQLKSDSTENRSLIRIFDKDQPIIFIDTRKSKEFDSKTDEKFEDLSSKFNLYEAKLTAQIVINYFSKLIETSPEISNERLSLLVENIGIITPYRAQVRTISQEIEKEIENHMNTNPKITHRFQKIISEKLIIDTVDKFQGRESEIILISLVDSNNEHILGEIHHEIRRFNVSLTRAKTKLIVIGNSEMFMDVDKDLSIMSNTEMSKKQKKRGLTIMDYMVKPPMIKKNGKKPKIYQILKDFVIYSNKNNGYIECMELFSSQD